jgi:hypothetical protein
MTNEAELIGGDEKREIVLVDYDAAWPHRFETERARIGGSSRFDVGRRQPGDLAH